MNDRDLSEGYPRAYTNTGNREKYAGEASEAYVQCSLAVKPTFNAL